MRKHEKCEQGRQNDSLKEHNIISTLECKDEEISEMPENEILKSSQSYWK